MLVQANLFISSALSSFDAQRWRPTTSFCATMSPHDVVEISDKRGLKCPKKPQNSPFCSALPSIVSAWAPPMAPSLIPATKYGATRIISPLSKLPYFAFFGLVGVLGRFSSSIGTHGVLLAHTGMFTAEKKKAWIVFGCSRFYAELRLPPCNSPDQCPYFRKDFSFYHPDFIVQVDFTDPPKLEGGVCHKPLCCRRCRRTWDEAEVVYHPDSFTCLIFDRRKSGCRGNAVSLYILLFCW